MWPVVTALNFTSLAATGPLPTDLVTTPVKWKWDDDLLNELLPDGPLDKAAAYGSLEFDEVLDETVLSTKFTVVNRAPLMTAWATVVAEHLGFEREEALSIASVYRMRHGVLWTTPRRLSPVQHLRIYLVHFDK
ncbi:hypothetical protein EV424DRAFT_890567 [Suillus variegatus]|nr:hypothetical protein EV424DRAFT_890567 [Suillus variegatus]